jgi:ArsR family transcriptional regulator, arsenate/arsenite/antimonite-responsive transcriptional repressor
MASSAPRGASPDVRRGSATPCVPVGRLTHQDQLISVLVVAATLTRSLEQTLRLFRALGDETRLRLVERLRGGEQCVCDLTDELEAGQSRLSFHLKTLKDAGIVTDRRQGRWVYYSLRPGVFEELESIVGELKPARTGLRVFRPECD